jgi:hypothetical protein
MDIKTTRYGLCIVQLGTHMNNGNLHVKLEHECGEPIVYISTNIIPLAGKDEFCANIFNIGKDLWNDIMASGFFEPTGGTVQSGFCEYPIYKLIRQTA